jgi:hypothetical protein
VVSSRMSSTNSCRSRVSRRVTFSPGTRECPFHPVLGSVLFTRYSGVSIWLAWVLSCAFSLVIQLATAAYVRQWRHFATLFLRYCN